MIKYISDFISKEEVSLLVFHAIGRYPTEKELEETQVYVTNQQQLLLVDPLFQQYMEIPLYNEDDGDPIRRVTIYKNGAVVYKNWDGRSYPLMNPIEVYKIIISKEKEFEQLCN